jgi:AcrR family transcriptional regulator
MSGPAAKPMRLPRAEKTAATRDAILAAALREFSARGFAATRLEDVAKRASVAKGTIYVHFRDKESLFEQLVRTSLAPAIVFVETLPALDMPLRELAEQLCAFFVREICETERKDVLRLIMTEGPRFPALAHIYYREVPARVLPVIRAVLERAHRRGEIPSDALARFPQLLIAPGLVGILWNSLFERFEPLDVGAFMRAHIELLFGPGPS